MWSVGALEIPVGLRFPHCPHCKRTLDPPEYLECVSISATGRCCRGGSLRVWGSVFTRSHCIYANCCYYIVSLSRPQCSVPVYRVHSGDACVPTHCIGSRLMLRQDVQGVWQDLLSCARCSAQCGGPPTSCSSRVFAPCAHALFCQTMS